MGNLKAYLIFFIALAQIFSTDVQAKMSDLSSVSYDSELAAVVAAVNKFNPRSILEEREYIGAILKHHDQYFYSVSAGKRGEHNVTTRIRFPKSMQLVALWHTHAGFGASRRYFSKVDTKQARKINKPFYMANYTGELKIFRPDDRTHPNGHAKGKIILKNMLSAQAPHDPVQIKTSTASQATNGVGHI